MTKIMNINDKTEEYEKDDKIDASDNDHKNYSR